MTDDCDLRFEQEGENEALIHYQGPKIRTQEELIALLKVDTEIWEPYQSKIKPYQAHAKREIKNLTFDEGKISGTVDAGGVIVATLFSVEVRFVRREMRAIHPLIFPVWSAAVYPKPSKPRRGGFGRAVIAADAQIGFERDLDTGKLAPFHDRRALDVLLQVIAEARPDGVYLPGDWGDFSEFSTKFIRRPEFAFTAKPTIFEGHQWLAWLRQAIPETPVYLFEGNHEKRIPDAMAAYLPFAYDIRRGDTPYSFPVMSVPYLWGLDRLGIEWVEDYPDAVHWLNERLIIEHGTTTKLRAESHVRFRGHDHRLGLLCRTIWGPEGPQLVCEYGVGCLSTTRAPGKGKRENWQQGFVVVDYEIDGGLFNIQPVIIEDGRAMWDGRIFVGVDRTEEIRDAYPDLNW